MRFTLYTELTVKQCLTAITERMEARETATRPAMDGWIEKGGRFSISITQPVILKFRRTTRLRATAERERGVTTIKGFVPGGGTPQQAALIFGITIVIGIFIITNSDALLGVVAVVIGAAVYIPLVGDRNNSEYLMKELQKITKAKDKPPA